VKATLTIIRGGPKEPSAMLAFEDKMSEIELRHITDEFNKWWYTGGVFLVESVALSVVDINLDITTSGVTLIPSK